MPSVLCYLNSFDRSFFPIEEESSWVLLLQCSIEIPIFNPNSVYPDQTPRSNAPDLGLHCMPMSILWDARHEWVRQPNNILAESNLHFRYKKKVKKDCLWKQRTHKIAKIEDSI